MEYETTDIILAAVLKLQGWPLTRIDIQGKMGTFVFDAPYDGRNVISAYDLGQITVEPVSFNAAIKQLTTSVRRMSNR